MLDLQRYFWERTSDAVMGRRGIMASEFSPRSGTIRRFLGMRTEGKQSSHLAGEGDRDF